MLDEPQCEAPGMNSLTIQASKPYRIHFSHGALAAALLHACQQDPNRRYVMITDSHVEPLWAHGLQQSLQAQGLVFDLWVFPAGEIHKTRDTKGHLEDQLLAKQYGRDTCLIALGGGVVLDLVGFVGATYCRGIPVIYIPTTLLAMVDACIGGKTGVNTPHGKNLIGTFTPPEVVLVDTSTLQTLPEAEFRNGMAEMIKHSVIADGDVFQQLREHVTQIQLRDGALLLEMIYASCVIKKRIVEQDETEQGIRAVLNFGHTIGHAIETIEHFQLGHGEAVAIGMLVESYLSVKRGLLAETVLVELEALLRRHGLPLQTHAFNDKSHFTQQLVLDKKTVNQSARFVLLEALGRPHRTETGHYTVPIDAVLLQDALDWAHARFMTV